MIYQFWSRRHIKSPWAVKHANPHNVIILEEQEITQDYGNNYDFFVVEGIFMIMTNIKITLILPYIFMLIEAQLFEQYLKGALC